MDKYQQLTTMYYNQHLGKGTASQIGSWTHRDVAHDIETFVNNNIGNMPFIEEVYVEQSFLNSTNRNGKGCSRPDLVIFNTLNSNVLIADIKTGKAKYGNRQKRKNEINIGTYTPSSRQNRVNVFIHQEVKP